MFSNKPEEEIDFCESYKSQILNNVNQEKSSSLGTLLKILIILLLLVVIVGLSIYGYNYFMSRKSADNSTIVPPSSIQISDEELKVTDESEDEALEIQEPVDDEKVEVSEDVPKVKEPVVENSSVKESVHEESDIDKIANDLKVAIAQNEESGKNTTIVESKKSNIKETTKSSTEEESLEAPVTSSSPEAKYLEDLAKLSEEIDKERTNK